MSKTSTARSTPTTPSRLQGPGSRAPAARRAGRGSTLLGVFIGLVIGLALAAGVAFYVMRASMPFQVATPGKEAAREVGKAGRNEKADAASDKPRFDFYKILPGGEEAKLPAEKKRDDRTDRTSVVEAKERAAEKSAAAKGLDPVAPGTADRRNPTLANAEPAAGGKDAGKDLSREVSRDLSKDVSKDVSKPGDRFWLQAGAFINESEAENLKARLALAGWQAAVQPAPIADKGVRFRVRLGPYDNTEELTRVKNDLGKRGFEVAVIKF